MSDTALQPTIDSLWSACTPDEHREMLESVLRSAPVALANPETAGSYEEFFDAVAAANNVQSKAFRRYPVKQQRGFAVKVIDTPGFARFREFAIRDWLLLHHRPLLRQLCDAVGVAHEDGMITGDATPPTDKVRSGLASLIASAPARPCAVYIGFLVATEMSGFGDLASAVTAENYNVHGVLTRPVVA